MNDWDHNQGYASHKKKKKRKLPSFHLPASKEAKISTEELLPASAFERNPTHSTNDDGDQTLNKCSILGSGIDPVEIRMFDLASGAAAPFSKLGLCPDSQRALDEVFGYKTMTRIQESAIPAAMRGNSVLGLSETGSGKTLAFLIPAAEHLHNMYKSKNNPMYLGLHTLILAPTRELVQQITTEAEKLLKFSVFIAKGLTGGSDFDDECEMLTEMSIIDVLVSTPSRLLQHLTEKHNAFRKICRDVKILIIDEMDRMMDEGFWAQLRRIIHKLPARDARQTLMFSATINAKSRRLAEKVLPLLYTTVSASPEKQIPQTYMMTSLGWLWCHLMRVLMAETKQPNYKVMVFFPTKIWAQVYADLFAQMDLPFLVTMMSSGLKNDARKAVRDVFMEQERMVMFTTDVSAHGMDYPGITTVVQVGMPLSPEQYIHRLGRTGRAGRPGKGVLLLMEFEECFIKYIQHLGIKKVELPRASEAEFQEEKKNYYRGMEPIAHDKGQRRKLATKLYVSLLRNYHIMRPVLDLHVEFRSIIQSINQYVMKMFRLKELPEVFGSKLEQMGLTEEDGVRRSKLYYNTMGRQEEEEEEAEDSEEEDEIDLDRLRYWERYGEGVNVQDYTEADEAA